jgi:SAM-dependent methyltransferase
MAASPALSGNSIIRCAVCATEATANDPPKQHHATHNDITYTLYTCPSCTLKFWWPLKADPSVYEDEGFEAYKDYHSGARPFPRWAEALFVQLPATAGRALDVGCGDGAVLARLAALGFETHGIDLDEKSISVARTKYGLTNVQSVTLDKYVRDCREHDTRFDLITFFEVLEHQDDPLAFLVEIASIAKSDGWIAGSVPNRDRFLARLDRKMSDGDLPPHHFLWFSQRSLTRLLESAGFQNVSITRVGVLSYAQVVEKLGVVISRKTKVWSRPMQLLAFFLRIIGPLAAVVPWLGMRFAPSHLFFKCRILESSKVPAKLATTI